MGLKVLIADDEYLERDVLELFLRKYDPTCRCLKAPNGKVAVEMACEYHPDICILDIQMPLLDGLECAKRIKESLPDSLILFITTWSSFDYAQEALRIGASDYLVKPVDYDTFVDRMDSLMAKFRGSEETGPNRANQFTREFFASLKYGLLSESSIEACLDTFGIHGTRGVALVLSGMDIADILCVTCAEERFAACRICYFPSPDRTTVLMFSVDDLQAADFFSQPRWKDCRIGVGRVFDTLLDIPRSIHTASVCHTDAVHSSRQMTAFRFHAVSQAFDRALLQKQYGDLVAAIAAGSAENARQILHEMIDGIKDAVGDQREGMRELYEMASAVHHDIESRIPLFHRPKPEAGTMMEVENYLMDYIDEATKAIRQDHQDKYARTFSMLRLYLDSHYMENPSQERIAESMGITGAYFCRLFKEYNGMTFSEYLTDVKMKRAQEMLRFGHTVQETSDAIGFSDSNYFARVFRQCFGCTPTEYRGDNMPLVKE